MQHCSGNRHCSRCQYWTIQCTTFSHVVTISKYLSTWYLAWNSCFIRDQGMEIIITHLISEGGVGASFTVWYMKRWMEQCYGLKCCFEKIQYVCDNILLLQLTLPIYYLVRSMNKYYHSQGLPPDPVMSTGQRPRMTQLSITTGTSKQSSSIQEIMITQLSMTRFLTSKSKE